MRTFVRVAHAGSFVEAAEQLGMAKSVVSRLVAELEAHLGASLIQRTTRRLTLTQVGETYLQDCLSILSEIEKAEERASADVSRGGGLLRIGAPLSFGTRQMPKMLLDFQAEYPDIAIDLTLLTSNMDVAKAGFDIVIHLWGTLPSAAVARKVSQAYNVACASPAYLAKHGTPSDPRELASHHCLIANFNGHRVNRWRFSKGNDEHVEVEVKGHLECNQTSVLHSAAVAGEGVIFLPTFLVGDDLANGTLTPLFPHLPLNRQNIYAVYFSRMHVTARARLFIDFMSQRWGANPSWDAWLAQRDRAATA